MDEWELYEPHHRARMAFRPGLTGMWQVSGRSNLTDFEEVVKLDTKYISEWSLKLDIYEPTLKDGVTLFGKVVVNDLAKFKEMSHGFCSE